MLLLLCTLLSKVTTFRLPLLWEAFSPFYIYKVLIRGKDICARQKNNRKYTSTEEEMKLRSFYVNDTPERHCKNLRDEKTGSTLEKRGTGRYSMFLHFCGVNSSLNSIAAKGNLPSCYRYTKRIASIVIHGESILLLHSIIHGESSFNISLR